jgi:hypothetical protein
MAIGQLIGKVIPKKEVARRLQARPKTTTKKKKLTKTTPKAAKMVQGAGDKSDPKVGKFGEGQKQARGGATPAAKEAMSSTEKDKLARDKAAVGSFKRAQGLKKGSLAQLEDAFDKLTAGAKRAQRLKGTKSKYYPVFKKRGMKPMKEGGSLKTVNKKKNPGLAKLPTPVRNKMGFAKEGGQVISKKSGGKVNMGFGDSLVRQGYDNN